MKHLSGAINGFDMTKADKGTSTNLPELYKQGSVESLQSQPSLSSGRATTTTNHRRRRRRSKMFRCKKLDMVITLDDPKTGPPDPNCLRLSGENGGNLERSKRTAAAAAASSNSHFEQFCNCTSLHGWKYLSNSMDSLPLKSLWLLIVFASMAVAAFFLGYCSNDFLSSTVQTTQDTSR